MKTLESNGYVFQPHEMPLLLGSPASPTLSNKYRYVYAAVGIFLAITAGLQNGLFTASTQQLAGFLGLDQTQIGWVQVAYYMTYASISVFYFKLRQHVGLNKFIRGIMWLLLASNLLQVSLKSYETELIARAISGLATSGLFTLSLYYIMQSLFAVKKLFAGVAAMGLMQSGTSLGQILVPALFQDGNMLAIYQWQLAFTLFAIGLIWWLPLPPAIHGKVLDKWDVASFFLFSLGVALLCGFLVQGRMMWWSTYWLGYLLAASVLCIGLVLFLEFVRRRPLLDWAWIFTPQIIAFGFLAAFVRVLTSEQTVGATGLLSALGMGNTQLITFYAIILFASLAGTLVSLRTMNLKDTRLPVVISLFGIALGAYLDMQSGVQTRPAQLYLSQAIIAFSSFYFLGPMMVEGMIRAFAKSTQHIMNFIAVFGLSQTLGALGGTGLFNAFITIRTQEHFSNISQHLTLVDPAVSQWLVLCSQQLSNSRELLTKLRLDATVLAYNDLFFLIFCIAMIAFVISAGLWLYRRQKGIILLAAELQAVAQNLKR